MGIKDTTKRLIYSGDRIFPDEIYKLIKDYNYVSFDIFDTLVKRNVAEPTDVYFIIEKKAGNGFRNTRIEAEKRARTELDKTEITIDDIYSYFPDNDRKRLAELELETELDVILPNLAVQEIYRRCINDGKTVFITSDMYWPEEKVKELLDKNKITGYKTLYLSSSQQKVKSDGSLFRYLLEQEHINPDQLIHIGDSRRGDYEEPKKLGIKAIKIPRYCKIIKFRGDEKNDFIELNYLNHFINNSFPILDIALIKDPYYQFGYAQFGKLLYGYVHWIHDEAVKRGIKKLFFFARDGFIMKQAYESCIEDPEIEIRYLEVSRRSLRGPILWMDCSFETIIKMVTNSKLVSLESIFDGLGLSIEAYIDIIRKYGFSRKTIFDRSSISNDERLMTLLDELKPAIIDNSKAEYKLLIRYLEDNAVSGKMGVIDIGYAGSMQRYLQQVLTQIGVEHEIIGFYMGVADFFTKNLLPGVKLDLNGYIFDFQHDKNAVDTRSSFVGLFETLFLEHAGSVKRYVSADGYVKAERYPYEYIIDGKPTEDMLKVCKIQQGALDFVNNAAQDKLLDFLKCSATEYFYGLYQVGTAPSLNELSLFGNIHFYDEGIMEKLAAPKSLAYYAVHPKELKTDFLKSRWKTGFLKGLFKAKLPYQRIYSFLLAYK